MTQPSKKSHSSPLKVLRQLPQSHWLGPLDPIPDMSFPQFLRLIHNHLDLNYQWVIKPSYVRVTRRHYDPTEDNSTRFGIMADDAGTWVDSEPITGMLDAFEMTQQQFKDAYNTFYGFTPPKDESPARPPTP